MPAAARIGCGSPPSARKLCRSILRRCPKAAAVTRSSVVWAQGRGAVRGTSRTTDEVTLGGGTKAEGATSNMILASVRHPAREHHGERIIPRRPGFDTEPTQQKRGRDVVGEVRDNARCIVLHCFPL